MRIDYTKELGLEDLPGEVWASVVGFDGYYEVSSMGRVKSLERTQYVVSLRTRPFYRTFKERIMKPSKTRSSKGTKTITWSVGLCVGSVYAYLDVHLMMAQAFDLTGGELVSHKDGDQLHNVLENLEMVSFSEKAKRTFSVGRGDRMIGVTSGAIYAKARPVKAVINGKQQEWKCASDAARELMKSGVSKAATVTGAVSGLLRSVKEGRDFNGIHFQWS